MDVTFNVPAGETIARDFLGAYLDVADGGAEDWAPVGIRTTDSSEEMDWSEETTQDIWGKTYTTMKKPVISQTFDPWPLSGDDRAQQKIYQLAIVDQKAQALTNLRMLIVHFYTTVSGKTGASFAERYDSCQVKPSSLGGEGGGNIGMPVDVTYGGERTVGTASKGADGAVTFTPAASSASALLEE